MSEARLSIYPDAIGIDFLDNLQLLMILHLTKVSPLEKSGAPQPLCVILILCV